MGSIQFIVLIPWINLFVLVLSTLLMFYFYLLSVHPAQLEKRIGPVAYERCGRYRIIASIFEVIVVANYALYYFFPLPLSIPSTFPWSYWLSVVLAVFIAIPSSYLMIRGLLDAGEEAMFPKKEQSLYSGIYEKIRHPQAMGELPLWWVVALLLNSPFLALYSIVWIPIFLLMCLAEEKDLLLRFGDEYAQYQQRTGFLIPRLYFRKE